MGSSKMKFLLLSCLVLSALAQRGGRGPKCEDGSKPTCSDGNRPQRGVGCSDGSTPACADGSDVNTASFPPCTGGRPICSDNSQPLCADGSTAGGGGRRRGRR